MNKQYLKQILLISKTLFIVTGLSVNSYGMQALGELQKQVFDNNSESNPSLSLQNSDLLNGFNLQDSVTGNNSDSKSSALLQNSQSTFQSQDGNKSLLFPGKSNFLKNPSPSSSISLTPNKILPKATGRGNWENSSLLPNLSPTSTPASSRNDSASNASTPTSSSNLGSTLSHLFPGRLWGGAFMPGTPNGLTPTSGGTPTSISSALLPNSSLISTPASSRNDSASNASTPTSSSNLGSTLSHLFPGRLWGGAFMPGTPNGLPPTFGGTPALLSLSLSPTSTPTVEPGSSEQSYSSPHSPILTPTSSRSTRKSSQSSMTSTSTRSGRRPTYSTVLTPVSRRSDSRTLMTLPPTLRDDSRNNDHQGLENENAALVKEIAELKSEVSSRSDLCRKLTDELLLGTREGLNFERQYQKQYSERIREARIENDELARTIERLRARKRALERKHGCRPRQPESKPADVERENLLLTKIKRTEIMGLKGVVDDCNELEKIKIGVIDIKALERHCCDKYLDLLLVERNEKKLRQNAIDRLYQEIDDLKADRRRGEANLVRLRASETTSETGSLSLSFSSTGSFFSGSSDGDNIYSKKPDESDS